MIHPAVEVADLRFAYAKREALAGIEFAVARGEIFGLLGPNGSGKTTLFRILSTLLPPQRGTTRVLGLDLSAAAPEVRRRIGVVFQSPSLDKKLTAAENLRHQGHLYGLRGRMLRETAADMLARLGVADRARERVEKLSGGLRRRVELAKGLLHRPELLLLDEPSTGLDPAARRELWDSLRDLRAIGVTVLLTTHLLEEAEHCDRLCILDRGRVVALGTPDALRSEIGGDCITVQTPEPDELAASVRDRFNTEAAVVDGNVRIERPEGHRFVAELVEAFPGRVRAIAVGKPTLEDVFIRRTGRRWEN